jgi:hypothetical protein
MVNITSDLLCVRFWFSSLLFMGFITENAIGQSTDEIHTLIKSINENPDQNHIDWTPSVERLIVIGNPSLHPCLNLILLSEDKLERRRASNVIYTVTAKWYGFIPGQGFSREDDEKEHAQLYSVLGNLDPDASLKERKSQIAKWKEYLIKQGITDSK